MAILSSQAHSLIHMALALLILTIVTEHLTTAAEPLDVVLLVVVASHHACSSQLGVAKMGMF